MNAPLEIWPFACLGLLALGLFGFVETLPFGAPRETLSPANRTRSRTGAASEIRPSTRRRLASWAGVR